CMQHRALPWTF
nr:immunoglobulin light chain junction region [Macaca mulatta]MOV61459.1 immunoglobulin light chain junction region [Macaca mulatta]